MHLAAYYVALGDRTLSRRPRKPKNNEKLWPVSWPLHIPVVQQNIARTLQPATAWCPKGAPKGRAGSRAIGVESPERILLYLPEKPGSGDGRDYQAQMAARREQESAIIAR